MSKVLLSNFWSSAVTALLLVSGPIQAAEKTEPSEASVAVQSVADGVPLMKVIDAVASRTQKRFLVDPRVAGNVAEEGLDLRKTSYRELQAILRLHGFAAIEVGGAINVVPESTVRSMPLPVIEKDVASIGEDDVVIKVVNTGKLDAARLVPLLRPMLPQYAHLAADPAINSLLVVARYGSVKTIEAVVRTLEKIPMASRSPVPSSGSEARSAN